MHWYHLCFEVFLPQSHSATSRSQKLGFRQTSDLTQSSYTPEHDYALLPYPDDIFAPNLLTSYRIGTVDKQHIRKDRKAARKKQKAEGARLSRTVENSGVASSPRNTPELYRKGPARSRGTDWRIGDLAIEWFDMLDPSETVDERGTCSADERRPTVDFEGVRDRRGSRSKSADPHLEHGEMNEEMEVPRRQRTKSSKKRQKPRTVPTSGAYIPFRHGKTELNAGILHLYRDRNEVESILEESATHRDPDVDGQPSSEEIDSARGTGTILCVLAVPAYMSAQDFLTFIGSMRDEMSHLRIVRDSLPNRYMVLIKFRSREAADVFVQEYNGREYSSLEPETCHVVYIKSVEFKSHAIPPYAFPPMPNDPSTLFLPNRLTIGSDASTKQAPGGMSMAPEETPDEHSPLRSSKSPVGPGLLELPTCPVCLDRMDASVSGLLTIVCHHTFHCHCLAKWGDSSCPVCRYSSRFSAAGQDPEDDMSNECMDCGSTDNLWICLICGNIGCGRYQEGHAQEHFTDTQHLYALELETQRVWDYAGDGYVHRLIQNRTDGKLVELPAPSRPGRIDGTDTSGGYEMNSLSTDGMSFRSNGGGGGFGAGGPGEPGNRKNGLTAENGITAEKMESIGLEYTYLLTSQLESQRTWYQQQLTKLESSLMDQIAAVMAALTQAQKDRDVAVTTAEQISEQLSRVEKDNRALQTRLAKLLTRALASEKEAREEKAVSASLLENQAAYQAKLALRDQALEEKEGEAGELREQVRDLMAFLDMRSQVENSGMGEVMGASVVGVAPPPVPPTGRKKGKGRKG